MKPTRTIRLSDVERAARSARMRALQADPKFQAARKAAIKEQTADRRAAQAELMRRMNADPSFILKKRAAQDLARIQAIKIPERTIPVVRGLFVEMNDQCATLADVAERAGIGVDTLRFWRFRSMPRADLLDAALNAVDLELAIVPLGTRDGNGFARKKG